MHELGDAVDLGREPIQFSKPCEKAILSHGWPGNVRELENAVERAVIIADSGKKIEAELLGIKPISSKSTPRKKK